MSYNYDNSCSDRGRIAPQPTQNGKDKSYFSVKNIINTTAIVALASLTVINAFSDLPSTGPAYLAPAVNALGWGGFVYFNSRKKNRFDEALREAEKGSKELLNNLEKYNLTDEQEDVILDTLFHENPIAFRSFNFQKAKYPLRLKFVKRGVAREQFYILQRLHEYIYDDQKQRYLFALEFCKIFPHEIGKYIPEYKLSHEQERTIAEVLAKDLRSEISQYIQNFRSLSLQEQKKIALIAAKTHPAKVYDNIDKYHPSIQHVLINKELKSYEKLNKLLARLETGDESVLDKILSHTQKITSKIPLPNTLSKKINKIFKHRTLSSKSLEELFYLIHKVNEYPSAITFSLVNRIHEKATEVLPQLSYYCYLEYNITRLKGKSFDFIAQLVDVPKEVHIYETVFVENLSKTVKRFQQNSSVKRAAIPISFKENLTQHFSLLYLEKDEKGSLRALISDSTGEESEREFPKQIIERGGDLPFKDLYIFHPQRQYSLGVCSVFTLSDILEILKYKDIFEVLDKHGDIEEAQINETHYKRVHTFPTGMMKMTQSMTRLRKIIETNEVLSATEFGPISHLEIDFQTFVNHVSPYEMDKNYGEAKRKNKYSEWALSQIFELLLIEAAKRA